MATENTERKQAAVAYLKQNGIPKCIETLLNNVVNDCPDDLYGYMAEYFAGLAKPPIIANVVATEIFSRRGYSSFGVNIESLIHGATQDLSTISAPLDTKPQTETKPVKGKTPVPESNPKNMTETDQAMEAKIEELHYLITNINNDIKSALIGCHLYEQQEVDSILQSIIDARVKSRTVGDQSETKSEDGENRPEQDESLPNDEQSQEELIVSPTSQLDTLTVSLAVAISASKLLRQQLYHYLYENANNKGSNSLCLPTPVITVLGSGKKTPGKLYILKEVMIFAKQDMPSHQALKQLTKVYQELEMNVTQKSPANIVSENGSLTPAMDRTEQALDLIREAVAAAGYELEDVINVVLRCCSSEVYDKDKQKYEISSGVLKSSDELLHMYEDLCERYPEIRVIIDPLVAQDTEGRLKLHEKIGDKCFIVNSPLNKSYSAQNFEKHTPGLTVRVRDSSTVTQFFEQVKTIKDEGKILLLSPDDLGNHEEYLIDMGVAAEADFVITEAPIHLEYTAKYNRLVAIEHHLVTTGRFLKKEELVPTIIVETTPEDEKENEEATT